MLALIVSPSTSNLHQVDRSDWHSECWHSHNWRPDSVREFIRFSIVKHTLYVLVTIPSKRVLVGGISAGYVSVYWIFSVTATLASTLLPLAKPNCRLVTTVKREIKEKGIEDILENAIWTGKRERVWVVEEIFRLRIGWEWRLSGRPNDELRSLQGAEGENVMTTKWEQFQPINAKAVCTRRLYRQELVQHSDTAPAGSRVALWPYNQSWHTWSLFINESLD